MRRTLVANQISWVMLVLFASAPLFAQSVRDSWEEFADATPFPTDMVAVPSWRFAHGPHVKAAFRDVVAEPSQATVRVRADGKKVAYGGIVRSDGWILTKASQLRGEITCRLADGRRFEATIGATNREYDLALLKIVATDLPILQYAEREYPTRRSLAGICRYGARPVGSRSYEC